MDKEFKNIMRISKYRGDKCIYPISLCHIRENTFGNASYKVYGGNNDIEEHEIYIFVEGEATAYIGNQAFHPKRGTIFTYTPEEVHEIYVTSLEPYERYVLLFHYSELVKLWDGMEDTLLNLFTGRNLFEKNMIQLPSHQTQQLLSLLEAAVAYAKDPNGGNEALFYSAFMKILYIINQGFLKMAEQRGEFQRLPVVSMALEIIEERFATLQSVTQLSNELNISDSYLARVFKKQVGTSVYEYILNMKFAHAVKLLAAGKSVTEACFDSGFNSYSHFIQMFKQKYGVTPRKYQKSLEV